jgi:hypothetical protein
MAGRSIRLFLCKQSGKLYYHSKLCDDLDSLPDDIGFERARPTSDTASIMLI